jgi:hypothetical protein
MQALNPNLLAVLVAICVGALMVNAGVAKRQLSLRARRPQRVRRWRRRW